MTTFNCKTILGLIVAALIIVLFSVWSSVASAGNAEIEVELINPPLAADVSAWGYSGIFYCADSSSEPYPSEEALIACKMANATASRPCAVQWDAAGDWVSEYSTGGITRDENKSYTYSLEGYSNHNNQIVCSGVMTTSGDTIHRRRDVACPVWYTPQDGRCVSDETVNVKGSPLTCPVADNAGDPIRGNPCDAGTGDKIETEIDYEGSGLKFARTWVLPRFHGRLS